MYLHTTKQQHYFAEVIRLHFEEGMGKDRISRRVPVGRTTIWRWINMYKSANLPDHPNAAPYTSAAEIKEMHDAGMSMRAIGRATGLSTSTIFRRIANFAIANKEQDMPQKQTETRPMSEKDAQARIAELEAELRKAELARDAYDGMINVAEARFNIPIRKKAGAKR